MSIGDLSKTGNLVFIATCVCAEAEKIKQQIKRVENSFFMVSKFHCKNIGSSTFTTLLPT